MLITNISKYSCPKNIRHKIKLRTPLRNVNLSITGRENKKLMEKHNSNTNSNYSQILSFYEVRIDAMDSADYLAQKGELRTKTRKRINSSS